MPQMIDLRVNGKNHRVNADPKRSLLSVLREDLELTGTRYGCGEAQCGACTVLLDGTATRSCVTPVERAAGKQITTIEGLEQNGRLHPVQQAFLEADAMQCGYCTSGMILSAVALLANKPKPTREEIIEHMNGNVCRCCTYQRIVTAIETAANRSKGAAK
jgi:aerobic-type carbon monoxide dehydrogenase small subunit (CoxS/CutS family)